MVMTIQAYAAHKADGVWYKPLFSLIPTLSIIDNVSKSTGILILNGETILRLQFNKRFSCNKD